MQKKGAGPLSGEKIVTMNWLNDNVEGVIPTEEELNEDALALVKISGLE